MKINNELYIDENGNDGDNEVHDDKEVSLSKFSNGCGWQTFSVPSPTPPPTFNCDGKSKEVEQRSCPYNEVQQRVWLVDPALFFPCPTPPPKVVCTSEAIVITEAFVCTTESKSVCTSGLILCAQVSRRSTWFHLFYHGLSRFPGLMISNH